MDVRQLYGKEPPCNGSESEDDKSEDGDDLYVPSKNVRVSLHDLSPPDTESDDCASVPVPAARTNMPKSATPTWKAEKSFCSPDTVKFSGDNSLPREFA